MLVEKEFKKKLIDKLNAINPGWSDGDKDIKRKKKADIVNHLLKIAIEIKTDQHYKMDIPPPDVRKTHEVGLSLMNKRFADHIKSANSKFEEYREYKTILLIRTKFPVVNIIREAIEGIPTYKRPPNGGRPLNYIERESKYSKHIRKEIGCFLIFSKDTYFKPGIYFLPNKFAEKIRILSKKEVEELFGLTFEDVP